MKRLGDMLEVEKGKELLKGSGDRKEGLGLRGSKVSKLWMERGKKSRSKSPMVAEEGDVRGVQNQNPYPTNLRNLENQGKKKPNREAFVASVDSRGVKKDLKNPKSGQNQPLPFSGKTTQTQAKVTFRPPGHLIQGKGNRTSARSSYQTQNDGSSSRRIDRRRLVDVKQSAFYNSSLDKNRPLITKREAYKLVASNNTSRGHRSRSPIETEKVRRNRTPFQKKIKKRQPEAVKPEVGGSLLPWEYRNGLSLKSSTQNGQISWKNARNRNPKVSYLGPNPGQSSQNPGNSAILVIEGDKKPRTSSRDLSQKAKKIRPKSSFNQTARLLMQNEKSKQIIVKVKKFPQTQISTKKEKEEKTRKNVFFGVSGKKYEDYQGKSQKGTSRGNSVMSGRLRNRKAIQNEIKGFVNDSKDSSPVRQLKIADKDYLGRQLAGTLGTSVSSKHRNPSMDPKFKNFAPQPSNLVTRQRSKLDGSTDRLVKPRNQPNQNSGQGAKFFVSKYDAPFKLVHQRSKSMKNFNNLSLNQKPAGNQPINQKLLFYQNDGTRQSTGNKKPHRPMILESRPSPSNPQAINSKKGTNLFIQNPAFKGHQKIKNQLNMKTYEMAQFGTLHKKPRNRTYIPQNGTGLSYSHNYALHSQSRNPSQRRTRMSIEKGVQLPNHSRVNSRSRKVAGAQPTVYTHKVARNVFHGQQNGQSRGLTPELSQKTLQQARYAHPTTQAPRISQSRGRGNSRVQRSSHQLPGSQARNPIAGGAGYNVRRF